MIFDTPHDWINNRVIGARLLGIDYGEKRIGLALSDSRMCIASAYHVYQSQSLAKDASHIHTLLKQESCWGIVLGFPLNMNGTEGPRCQATKTFARALDRQGDVPILLWDERLSTKAMNDLMIHADVSRKKRQKSIDKTAASFILQGLLDWVQFSGDTPSP